MTEPAPVKVPKELLGVSATSLEDYVRSRLLQFIKRLGISLSQLLPSLTPALLDRAVHDTLRALPLPDYGQIPVERRQLQLVFRHDCQALGCLEPQCPLCQHNSKRRCTVNFCKKYLVNDRMLARCGAQIRIEVIDRATGRLCDTDLSDVFLEVFVLNGAAYDQRFLDSTRTSTLTRVDSSSPDGISALNKDLDECALLTNNKAKPLLASLAGGKMTADGKLLLQVVRGRVVLPDVTITDSSEALLSGRKPPFRLVVRAKHKGGQQLSLRAAVSEAFVVATRRVRTSHKADIPTMDDPVAKLMHMGKETCKKLSDLPTAAKQANMELELDQELACVEKVGEFKALALHAETDSQLRQQLQTLLKLPKDKWDEAAEHAKRAVFPDNRPRAWYADRTGAVGLLFPANLGVVDLKRPKALLQRVVDATGAMVLQAVSQQQQTPVQRDAVRQLLPQAEECWWSPGHPGWTLLDADAAAIDTVQASISPSLSPAPQLAPTALPATPTGKALLMASPAAAAGPPAGDLAALPPQLLQAAPAATMAGLQASLAAAPTGQVVSPAVASLPAGLGVLPQPPELCLGHGIDQPQQMTAGTVGPLSPHSPLQVTLSNSSFSRPAWWTSSSSAALLAPAPAPPHSTAATLPAPPATTPPRFQVKPELPVTAASPQTPAIPSAFAALAAQPIAAGSDSPPRSSAAPPAFTAAAAAAAGAAAPAGRAPDPSGLSSSGLGSSLQQSRKSSSGGGSLLPPLSGRKRSYALVSAAAAAEAASSAGRSSNPAAAAGSSAPVDATPATQLSEDMEKLLTTAGLNPGLPGAFREAPSLSAFPSMGLFVDTVSPAAAAGGGTGAALLRGPGGPSRAASAGMSRLLSLDLASLLRGTSMFPSSLAGNAAAAAAAAAGGSGGDEGVGGAPAGDRLSTVLEFPAVVGGVEDDGLPTPHAAAAAEGLMALSDPMGGSSQGQAG